MKRPTLLPAIVGLSLILSACHQPPPKLAFAGTTTTEGTEQPLLLELEQRGEWLHGEYTVRAAVGLFRGTLQNTTVTAELIPGNSCSYTFEGTVEDDGLTGSFVPTDCPGGVPGTWSLQRQ